MSLALESLIFEVDSKQLESALGSINKLATAVSNFNREQDKETRQAIQAEKVKQEQAKTEKELAKAKEASLKATQASERAIAKEAKAVQDSTTGVSKLDKLIANLGNTYSDLSNGMTRGESSILNTARNLGATATQLDKVNKSLKDIGTLTKNPFDASLGAIRSISKELENMQHRVDLATKGIVLSTKQLGEYSRISDEIAAKMKTAGQDISSASGIVEFNKRVKDAQSQYLGMATQVQAFSQVEKDAARVHRENANAVRALAIEEEKVTSIIKSMNAEVGHQSALSEKTAISIAKYERNLKLAGVSASEATQKLAVYKTQLKEIQSVEEKRKIDYLSRSLTPQISDVAVSLYGGMNPFTVLMQQGLQVRDLISQSGVEAGKLQQAFRTAASDMVGSIKGTAMALSSLLIGSIVDSGKAIVHSLVNPAIAGFKALREASQPDNFNFDLGPQISRNTLNIRNLMSAFVSMGKVIAGGVVAAIGVFTIAMYGANKQTEEVIKQFALSGNSLGLMASSISSTREELNTMNISMSKSSEILAEMSKVGNLTSTEIMLVAVAASNMSKYADISIEDTVKSFSKMKKEPVEALLELSNKTGLVSAETFKSVMALKEQGDQAGASSLAITELARVNSVQVEQMKSDYSSFSLFIKNLGSDISSFFDNAFKSLFDKYDFNVEAKKIANKTIAELSKIEDTLSRQGKQLSADQRAQLEAANATLASYAKEESAIRATRDAEQGRIKLAAEMSKLQKENQTELDKHQDKLKSFDELRKRASTLYANDQEALKSNMKEIAKLEESELTRYNEKMSKKANGNNEALKEAEKLTASYDKAIERFADLRDQINRAKTDETKSVWETTKAYSALKDIMRSADWKEFDDIRKKSILTEYANLAVLEVETLELVNQRKALKDLDKMYQDFNKDRLKGKADIEETSNELDFQYSILNRSEKEIRAMTIAYEEQKNIARILTEYEIKRLDIMQKYAAAASGLTGAELESQAKILIASLSELATEEEKKLFLERQKSNLKVVQDYEKRWSRIQGNLSEILYDSLFKGGKTAAEDIRKLIEDELKKEFIIPEIKILVNYVTGAVGQVAGSLGNAAINGVLGTSGSNNGAGTNYLGLANNASTIYSSGSYATAAAAAYSQYSAGIPMSQWALGTYAPVSTGVSTTGVAANSMQGSTGGLTTSTIGWVAAIVMGMYMSGEAWQKGIRWEDYAKEKGSEFDLEKYIRAAHDEPARAIFGDSFVDSKLYSVLGGGSLSAQIHGAIKKGLWGGEWEATGAQRLRGTFSEEEQFSGGQVGQKFKKDGGWFKSDKKEIRWKTLGSDFDAMLDEMYRGIRNTLVATGEIFEDDTLADKLKGFTQNIMHSNTSDMQASLSLMSEQLTQELGKVLFPSIDLLRTNTVEQAKALKFELEQAKRSGNLALVDNLEAQIKNLESLSNETWSGALGRILQESQAIARIFDLMGTTLLKVFGAGNADRVLFLSDALAQMFGGIDKLNESFGAYYTNFYSAEEQRIQAMDDMGKSFKAINLTMPTTREGFRKLVDGLDLSTMAGQGTFKALMDLQGAFASLVPAISETTDALQKAQAAQLSKNQETQANQISKYLEYVRKQQQDLINEQVDASKGIADAARATADTFRNILKSLEEYRRSLLQSASSTLNPNQKYAEAKLSYESTTAKAKAGDVDSINNIKAVSDAFLAASMDVSSIAGYNTDFSSVLATIDSISASATGKISNSEQQLIIANQQLLTLQQIRDSLAATNSAPLVVSDIQQAVKDWDDWFKNTKVGDIVKYDVGTTQRLSESMGMLVDNMGKAFTFNKDDSPYSLANESTAWYEEMISRYGKWSMPSFDVGTNYVPNDMIANIHKGERIIPAADNASLMTALSGNNCIDNSEMIIELRALRLEVASLRSERTSDAVVIARNTRVTSQILEKFDIDGMPPERVD